jgi:hypothetical protein
MTRFISSAARRKSAALRTVSGTAVVFLLSFAAAVGCSRCRREK